MAPFPDLGSANERKLIVSSATSSLCMRTWFSGLLCAIFMLTTKISVTSFVRMASWRVPHHRAPNFTGSTLSSQRRSYYDDSNMQVLNHLALLDSSSQVVVILCGIPGCGKSTYARNLIGRLPAPYQSQWVIANQDTLGTRQSVIHVARQSLESGKSVIIDRCNFNETQRAHWVDIAYEYNVAATIGVVMPNHTNLQLCIERATARGISDGHAADINWRGVCMRMQQDFQYPTMAEGFTGIFHCQNEDDLTCFANSIADIGLRHLEMGSGAIASEAHSSGGLPVEP